MPGMREPSARPLAAIVTLGCKLNFADGEEIGRGLRAAGFDVVDRLCDADAFVLNTCSVTHIADRKARRLIRSVRRMAPAAAIAVTGCFPRTAGETLVKELGADFVRGTRDVDKEALTGYLAGRVSFPPGAAAAPRRSHTRAFVKAQEGCNDVCAFCIVPKTRGREDSRSIAAVAAEVERATSGGVREVVITGTQLGAWGRDFAEPLLPHHLISGLLEATEVSRIRFSSLQPQDIRPELLALWEDPRLMPHFHLALQSGSERVLSAMRRRYTAAEFLAAADRIVAAVPGAAITTDVIAGFPGESDAEFEETLALCREVRFARVHAFPYSPRTGTAAARMPGRPAPEALKERMARLMVLARELQAAFFQRHLGTVWPVLWESRRDEGGAETWSGHTDNYIPVVMPGSALHNRITPAVLRQVDGGRVRAVPVGEGS